MTTLRGDRLLDHKGYVQVSEGVAIGMSYDPTGVLHGQNNGQNNEKNSEMNEIQWRNAANLRSNINGPTDAPTPGLGTVLPHHVVGYYNHQRVFVLSAEGGVMAKGGMSAGNGTFTVSPLGMYRATLPTCHLLCTLPSTHPATQTSCHSVNL